MKKVLILFGGWDGHEPKETAYIAKEILEKEYEIQKLLNNN